MTLTQYFVSFVSTISNKQWFKAFSLFTNHTSNHMYYVEPQKPLLNGVQMPHGKRNFWEGFWPTEKHWYFHMLHRCELCKNG